MTFSAASVRSTAVWSVGSFALLLGIGLLYGRTGALNFAQVGQALAHRADAPIVVVSMTLVLTGFLVKAAIVPFHFWLADAHAVAPTSVRTSQNGQVSFLPRFTHWPPPRLGCQQGCPSKPRLTPKQPRSTRSCSTTTS